MKITRRQQEKIFDYMVEHHYSQTQMAEYLGICQKAYAIILTPADRT